MRDTAAQQIFSHWNLAHDNSRTSKLATGQCEAHDYRTGQARTIDGHQTRRMQSIPN